MKFKIIPLGNEEARHYIHATRTFYTRYIVLTRVFINLSLNNRDLLVKLHGIALKCSLSVHVWMKVEVLNTLLYTNTRSSWQNLIKTLYLF